MPQFRLPSTPLQWLTSAGILHVAVTLIVYLVGHFSLVPAFIDGNGLTISIAIDGLTYHDLQIQLVEVLRNGGWHAWMEIQSPLHARLYSLCFVLLGKLFGYNILATEPLNVCYYLATLTFVFLLGREIFNPRAGALAAIIVGLWPSLLLFSTQMIRDPLANMSLIALVYLLTVAVARELTWRHSAALVASTVVCLAVLWMARANMWNVVVAGVAVTALLVVVKMISQRRLLVPNVILVVAVSAAALIIPARLESPSLEGVRPPVAALSLQSASDELGPLSRMVKQIGHRRAAFRRAYAAKGSNIDVEVSLLSVSDILKYLPRAAVIGFFAPFPNLWLERGSEVGFAGRVVSGIEMLMMYGIYIAVIGAVWSNRSCLPMWLSFAVASVGIIGLGLIVANVGALYRLRYGFWVLLIVVGAEGILEIAKMRNKK